MAGPDIVETACARAWSVYRMINRDTDDNDERRAILRRFIQQRFEAGSNDPEYLPMEGLKYLKRTEGELKE